MQPHLHQQQQQQGAPRSQACLLKNTALPSLAGLQLPKPGSGSLDACGLLQPGDHSCEPSHKSLQLNFELGERGIVSEQLQQWWLQQWWLQQWWLQPRVVACGSDAEQVPMPIP